MKTAKKIKQIMFSFLGYFWEELYYNQEKKDFERLKRFISS